MSKRIVVLIRNEKPEYVTRVNAELMVADGDAFWIGNARRKVRLILPVRIVDANSGQSQHVGRKELELLKRLKIVEYVTGTPSAGMLYILKRGPASARISAERAFYGNLKAKRGRALLDRRRSLRHDGRQLSWRQTDQHVSSEIRASVLAENVVEAVSAEKRAGAAEARNSE